MGEFWSSHFGFYQIGSKLLFRCSSLAIHLLLQNVYWVSFDSVYLMVCLFPNIFFNGFFKFVLKWLVKRWKLWQLCGNQIKIVKNEQYHLNSIQCIAWADLFFRNMCHSFQFGIMFNEQNCNHKTLMECYIRGKKCTFCTQKLVFSTQMQKKTNRILYWISFFVCNAFVNGTLFFRLGPSTKIELREMQFESMPCVNG